MGGEKFDTPHPEGYLFGENMDLNFLGSRPVQFPYVTPAPHEPVKTLRSLVNIRKDSLRLVRYKDDADSPTEDGDKPRVLYSLEFTFDADARVAITIYCQASEEFLNGRAVYSPKSPSLQSETVHYKRGVSQQFSLPSFKIDFLEWKDDELNFDLDRGVFPVVIQAVVDEGDVVEVTGHAHVLLAAFEKHMDGSFSVKPLKQKQIVDRVSYLLQEIYGIENKNNQETKVCTWMSIEPAVVPDKYVVVDRSQGTPPSAAAFRALLQIRAVRKKPGALSPVSFSPVLAQSLEHDEHSCPFKKSKPHPASLTSKKPKRETSSDSVPPGYEPISLLEALNGLRAVSPAIPSAPLYEEITYSGISDGLSQASCPLAAIDHILDSSRQKGRPQSKAPDSTLRSPSSPIHEEDEEKLSEDVDAPPPLGGAELALRESSSPESFITEEVDESSSPKQGTRAPSIENVLQDSSPERCGRGPPADIYLPGWPASMETAHGLGTTSPTWPPPGGPSPDPSTAELAPL
ncbi:PREDICTED: E3 ubiquitin-protein ligase MGRN1 [Mandrillus leucophaeus]|uniref:E3 ubiquitin-protein ligase MGRN1 n=1 Tax=Mandrillus leucophaeus TaxID=9568 RepID=UPI0005F551E3|nr:PREDICTED: E3 ubiquitin-protein ligase MGRN1 [Mandrillus leucophaeus]